MWVMLDICCYSCDVWVHLDTFGYIWIYVGICGCIYIKSKAWVLYLFENTLGTDMYIYINKFTYVYIYIYKYIYIDGCTYVFLHLRPELCLLRITFLGHAISTINAKNVVSGTSATNAAQDIGHIGYPLGLG